MALHQLKHIKHFCVHTSSLLSFVWDHGPPLAQDPDAISEQAGAYAELVVHPHGHLGQEGKETIQDCIFQLETKKWRCLSLTQQYTRGSKLKHQWCQAKHTP